MRHEFVEAVPVTLDEGVLYVSVRYRTASHLCACGCGLKVVTPIRPNRWILTFNGDDVSLWPSIGRGQLPCRSHYWIKHDRVHWARTLTDEQVAASLERDQLDVRRYYGMRLDGVPGDVQPISTSTVEERLDRLRRTLRRVCGLRIFRRRNARRK